MSNKKFTAKKFLYIVVLTTLILLGYCGIFLFSLPLTLNAMTSWILSLSFVVTVALLCIVSMLRERKQRKQKLEVKWS
jgi:protein-S-isoprenylcysteine O-methyltransferase Ste14